MKKWLIAGGAVVALGAGSLAVAVVNPLGIATAGTVTVGQEPGPPGTAPDTPPSSPAPDGDESAQDRGRGEHWRKGPGALRETLGELVAEGVITQEQADAILARLKAKFDQHVKDHPGGPGGRGALGAGHGPGHGFGRGGMLIPGALETAATTIGISEDELVEGIKGGKTVAQVAQDKGVDPQAVIDALVTRANAKIDERAADGSIPPDKVEAAKQKAVEFATSFVNETRPKPGVGNPGHGWGRGPR